MFSLIQDNWWSIVLILLTTAILFGLKYFNNTTEGFTPQNVLHGFDKMVVCPMLKNNLLSNSKLLEGYTEQHAATSIERTSNFIDNLKSQYTKYDCDGYFQSMPKPEEVKVDDAQKS
jgi:hypothetical protein